MTPFKLLIADDNKQLAELYKSFIADLNLDVSHCESAVQAQKLLTQTDFDIVVTDWDLPESGGIDLCRWVRGQKNGDFPFLLTIADKNDPDTIKSIQVAECDDYLVKPFDPVEFNVRINVALYTVKQRRKLKMVEYELIQAKMHREVVLDSLNLGTALLSEDNTTLYFNGPLNKMFSESLVTAHNFLEQINAEPVEIQKLKEILNKKAGKVSIKTREKWLNIECFINSKDEKVLYAIDNTELMLLKQQNYGKERLIGEGRKFTEMLSQVELLARGDWSVLIEGKTCSGKELVARELHARSKRGAKTYLTVNCAELTETIAASILFGHKKGSFTGAMSEHEGYFEAANGGTLFLDEIGDLPHSIQVMLLRAIEQKEIVRVGDTKPRKIDVRIIAATNKTLTDEVAAGKFRDDLYYRLNETVIKVPTLAERREDIPMLIDFFVKQNGLTYPELSVKISNDAVKALVNYDWPGNIRQLKSALQFAAIQAAGNIIDLKDLPAEIRSGQIKAKVNTTAEKNDILAAIKNAGENYSTAAATLGISRATLYRKMKKYNIKNNNEKL